MGICVDEPKNHKNNKYLIGLNNIGETCYMNSALQCLWNTKSFSDYFLHQYKSNLRNNKKNKISNALQEVFYKLWDKSNPKNYPYSPNRFKAVIGEENELFKGKRANDSKDLINFILQTIHEELNKPKGIVLKNNFIDYNQLNNEALRKYQLTFFLKNEELYYDSIIHDLFYGIHESQYICKHCNSIKYNFEFYYFLEFPLREVNLYFNRGQVKRSNGLYPTVNLYECFEFYQKIDNFFGENQIFCNRCNTKRDASFRMILYSLPNYLIIILNREKGNIYKCEVEMPEILNLEKYVQDKTNGYMYDLYGCICHLGPSSESGHFIAYCRHKFNNRWHLYNDSVVKEIRKSEDLFKGTPYILFYQKIIV